MRKLLRRVRYWLGRHERDAELADELAFHRAMTTEALEADGLPQKEALGGAQRRLGNDLLARDRSRDVWIWPWLHDLNTDVRLAFRLLTSEWSHTLAAVLALGVGMGVNGAMFAIYNAYCLAGLPIQASDRVVYISTLNTRAEARGVSVPDFEDLRRTRPVALQDVAAFKVGSVSLSDEPRAPERLLRAYVSAGALALTGARPVLGRAFDAADDRPGAPPTVLLAGHVWRIRYGADPALVGRTVRLNGKPATIIGIMPDGYMFPNRAEVWQPLALMADGTEADRQARTLGVFARLADNATLPVARSELQALAARLASDYPQTNDGVHFAAEPINWRYSADMTHPAWIAFISVGGLILLIACANVANLMLTRGVVRGREMAIRASLGATRARIVRQLLAESGVLALCGAGVGLLIAKLALLAFARAIPEIGIPFAGFQLDGRVLAVFAVGGLLATMLFGLAPAATTSRLDVNSLIKDGGRGVTGHGSQRWTSAFLVVEMALTVLLLVQVGIGYRRAVELRQMDEVIDTSSVLTAQLTLPAERYPSPAARAAFHERLAERLAGIGGIVSAAVAGQLPLEGALEQTVEVAGVSELEGESRPAVQTVAVGPGYFETLDLPVRRGRGLTARDDDEGAMSAVVNEEFVARLLPDRDPVGQRIRLRRSVDDGTSPWLTIVGVAATARQRATPDPDPIVYVPFGLSSPATAALLVRTAGEPQAMAEQLRLEVASLDRDVPLYRVMTGDDARAAASWTTRVGNRMVFLLACIAVMLATVGLYAVTAHTVARRTAELCVRLALGARPRQLGLIVLRRALAQASVGLVFGLIATVVWGRAFGVAGTVAAHGLDRMAVSGVAAMVLAIVVIASLVPVRRATRVDPAAALREV